MAVIHNNNGPILEEEGLGITIGTKLVETYFPDTSLSLSTGNYYP